MGMYDCFGENKMQVKCFYHPILISAIHDGCDINLARELKEHDAEIMYSDGSLTEYYRFDKVPHSTIFYKYGRNFMVFDPSNIDGGEKVHIILGGRYMYSIHWSKLNKMIHKIGLVIDKYGKPLNIKFKEDFYAIILDYQYFMDKFDHACRNGSITENMTRLKNDIFATYRDKWYLQDSIVSDTSHVGHFLSAISTNSINMSDAHLSECVKLFENHCGGELEMMRRIVKYYEWTRSHRINISLEKLLHFFKKPTHSALRNILGSYRRSK